MLLDPMTHASFRSPMQKRKTLRLNAAVAAFSAPFTLFREEVDRTVELYERGIAKLGLAACRGPLAAPLTPA
jgi:hypothetical protein